MPSAGTLQERIGFDSRSPVDDAYGASESAFMRVFEARAARKFLRGSEAVQAARLEGKQPVLFTVRSSALSRALTTDYRIVDLRSAETYNITAVNPTQDRQWIEILAVSGGVDG